MSLFMLLLVKLLHIVADLAMLLEPHTVQTNINVLFSSLVFIWNRWVTPKNYCRLTSGIKTYNVHFTCASENCIICSCLI